MKLLRYILLGLAAYLVFILLLFPASLVVDRLNLKPISLTGLEGPLWNGSVAKVITPNTSLPTGPDSFLVEDVHWRLAPAKLLSGAAGVSINFSAYGGEGSAVVAQMYNGDTVLTDLVYQGTGKSLSILLDPFVKIGGNLTLEVSKLLLKQKILRSLRGSVQWTNATIEVPVQTTLGTVSLEIKPEGEQHLAKISTNGGDLEIKGKVTLEANGNFQADITIKSKPDTPVEVVDMLRGITRPSSDGRFRIRRNGNINRLM